MKEKTLIALFAGLSLIGSASANTLGFGGSGAPDALSLAGMTLVNSTGGPADALTYNATYEAAVYVGNNTECGAASNCLTYVYQWKDVSATGFENDPGIIQHITGSSFSGVLTDVGYATTLPSSGPFTSLGTVQPGTVDRSALPGQIITFDFIGTGAINAGQTSDILVIETNATVVEPGLTSAQDGSTVTEAAFGASLGASTPEPASIFLLGTGLHGVGLISRKKNKTR